MRISLEWIKEFVAVTAAADEVAHRLTMAGLEIEGMESIDGDVVMEVNVTPNRPMRQRPRHCPGSRRDMICHEAAGVHIGEGQRPSISGL
jgi:hypothetical protein